MTVPTDLAARILMATGYKGESDRARALEIQIWAAALHDDTTLEDALQAIAYHRGNVGGYLEPVHINRLTARYRESRLDHVQVPIPDGLADQPHLEVRWQTEVVKHLKAGRDLPTAMSLAWQAIDRQPPQAIESSHRVDAREALKKFKTAFGKGTK